MCLISVMSLMVSEVVRSLVFCDSSPLRFLSRLRRTAVLLLAGQCFSSLRRMLVMASGFCASWCEPMPGCPLNCWPSFRASGWPARTIRLSSLSVATWRASESAGLLIRCLCLGQIIPSQNVILSGNVVFHLTAAVKYQYFSQRIWSFIF